MNAADRIPLDRSARNAARSPPAQCAEREGRSAVMIETVKMAWGSWKNVNAEMYAV